MSKLVPIHIIPDTHVPFHDKRAWNLNLQIIKDRKPQHVVILGDFADFYSINGHGRDPKHRNLRLLDEINAVNHELDRLDKVIPRGAKKYFIQGNHEYRLDRYIAQKAPEMDGLTTTPEAFHLKKRGWHYTPYHHFLQLGKVFYTHDTGKAGASAHISAANSFNDNAVIGHTHRASLSIVGNNRGKPHVAAMFGWLGDINAAEYMHLINARRDWALGFGTGHMASDGTTFLQVHPIVNYTACVDGVLYKEVK